MAYGAMLQTPTQSPVSNFQIFLAGQWCADLKL